MAKSTLFRFKGKSDSVAIKKVDYLAVDEDPFNRYKLFEAMYDSNNLYQDITRNAYDAGEYIETLMSIATPCNRSVEFYSNRLLMGARVSSKNQPLADAVNIFLRDSNFNGIKDNYSRELAKLGDLFVRLKNDENHIWMERIEARHVTEVNVDSRSIIQDIRIDIPIEDNLTYTEYWTNEMGGYVAIWEHKHGINAELEQLGTPKFTALLTSYGVTFIPIVYIKFTSKDNKRAENAFVHAISKIHESNRERSRLAELMFAFNTAIWTAYGSETKSGYLGEPEVKLIKSDDGQVIQYIRNIDEWKSNIPPLDYQAHLAMFKDMRDEMTYDLPETKLNSLDPSQISGKAVQSLLGESINRAKTARANLVHGLKRLCMMAISLGQFYGFMDRSLGTYVQDDFQFDIICDAIIPLDPTDKALMLQQFTSAGVPLKSALRFSEYTEAEIEQVMQDLKEELDNQAASFFNNPSFTRDVNNQTQ